MTWGLLICEHVPVHRRAEGYHWLGAPSLGWPWRQGQSPGLGLKEVSSLFFGRGTEMGEVMKQVMSRKSLEPGSRWLQGWRPPNASLGSPLRLRGPLPPRGPILLESQGHPEKYAPRRPHPCPQSLEVGLWQHHPMLRETEWQGRRASLWP